MNTGPIRSKHAVWAAVVVAATAAWSFLVVREPWGSRDSSNVVFLLTTGWVAVAAFVFLAAYGVRKAAHRTGLSPEFRAKTRDVRGLERAESALRRLSNESAAGALLTAGELRTRAKAILNEHGAGRLLRAELHPTARGLEVVAKPRQPLAPLAAWLSAHVWYGVAAALLVLFHGGGRLGSPMGLLLNGLSLLVILSGIVGIVLWMVGPTWLTAAERDLSTEQAFVLRAHYDRKVAALVAAIQEGGAPLSEATAKALSTGSRRTAKARAEIDMHGSTEAKDLAILLSQRDAVDDEWARLRRTRGWMTAWRLFHVPASVVLLALVVVHVFSVIYY